MRHETLPSLINRALLSNPRPLEFYLREQSRLPGIRANMELVYDLSHLLTSLAKKQPESIHRLLHYLISDERQSIFNNTAAEFVVLCGVVSLGMCATVVPRWRSEAFEVLGQYACSPLSRVREGVSIAFQKLLATAPRETTIYLTILATQGNYFQQRAAIAAIAEQALLRSPDILNDAFAIQYVILERLHKAPATDRKREDFRALRQALGYTVSILTAAAPEKGFALMRNCATWRDRDVTWILRENLKKKRLAKYIEDTEGLYRMLA